MRTIFLIQLLFLSCLSIGQTYQEYYSTSFNSGMIEINDTLFIDETEVVVLDWIFYYKTVLKTKGEEAAKVILPDSSLVMPVVWEYFNILIEKTTELNPLKKCPDLIRKDDSYKLIQDKKKCRYGSYPITGISYEQAIGYCNWRTESIKEKSIIYRLPTKNELILVAEMNLKSEIGLPDSINANNSFAMFNYRMTESSTNYEIWGKNGMGLKAVGLFTPLESGIYDLFGNVSEMVLEVGKSKGGNYSVYAKECDLGKTQEYKEPQDWLGFRCVAIKR